MPSEYANYRAVPIPDFEVRITAYIMYGVMRRDVSAHSEPRPVMGRIKLQRRIQCGTYASGNYTREYSVEFNYAKTRGKLLRPANSTPVTVIPFGSERVSVFSSDDTRTTTRNDDGNRTFRLGKFKFYI